MGTVNREAALLEDIIMNTFLNFFVSLVSAKPVYEHCYQAHEIERFFLELNTLFKLNINVAQAMEFVASLQPEQLGSTTLNAVFCDCPHTVKFDCERRSDGLTIRFKSASMPLDHAINSQLKEFTPSTTVAEMELAHAG